jgi:hypothetical protein
MLVGADDGSIDEVLLPIDLATRIGLSLQLGQDARPKPASLPPREARGDRLPRPIVLGQVAPGRPSLGDPKHAVDDAPMVVERAAASSREARRQERGESHPLVIGQFMTSHVRYSTAFSEHALGQETHPSTSLGLTLSTLAIDPHHALLYPRCNQSSHMEGVGHSGHGGKPS